MKKLGNSLHISIPKPCSVAWDKMEQRENARFCSTCQKEVVDFSKLNNKQLLQYISTNRQIPCGRFHSSQLNKNLLQEEKRYRYWKKVYKTILAVLTFLSLKPANAVAQGRPITITEPTNKKISGDTSTSLVTITGTVRDSKGEPLEGAVISVSEVEMARTDHNGQFRFENKQMEFLLVVHYTGMTRIVRNYHPAMQSTAYNLIMEPPIVCSDHILGVPIINDFIPSIEIDFSPIHPANNEVREDFLDLRMLCALFLMPK